MREPEAFPDTAVPDTAGVLHSILAAFNPVELWRALREAEDGVCLMAAVPVRAPRQRRR